MHMRRKNLPRTDYSEIAKYYDNVRGSGGLFHGGMRDVAQLCGMRAGGLFLDIGCGTGQYCLALSGKFRKARLVGLDSSREMVARARKKDRAGRVGWVVGDAQRLPFKPGILDGAYMTFVIHHVASPKKAFREIRKALKDGAAFANMTSSHARLRRTPYALFPRLYEIDAARFPTIPELMRQMRVAGFCGVRHKNARYGLQRLPVTKAVENARTKFISTFTLMSDEEIRKGIPVFKRRLAKKYGNAITRTLEADFVSGEK